MAVYNFLCWSLFVFSNDIDGDNLTYFIDCIDGTTNETDYYPSGEIVEINHSYSGPGVYYIIVKAIDIYGEESDWSDPYEVIIENNPPQAPTIDGPISGKVEISYNFTFNSVDLDGEDVYYQIKWGDGYVEDWIGPFASGEDFEIAHTYSNKNTYTLEAKARDIYGDESDIATYEITIPRSRFIYNSFFNLIFERFPNLERLFDLLNYNYRI
jgi:hypothetical protein